MACIETRKAKKEYYLKFLIYFMVLLAPMGLAGEEEKAEKKWSNSSELSIVSTSGNSESETFGFKNDYNRKYERGELQFKISGLRAENTKVQRVVNPDGTVSEIKTSEKTAENYHGSIQYSGVIKEKFNWFTKGKWDRNEFSGIRNRASLTGGLENQWIDNEITKLKTEYGLSYIIEEGVFEPEGFDDQYTSASIGVDWKQKVSKTTDFLQTWDVAVNLEDSDDIRLDLNNSLSASLTGRLALKVGLQVLYDNQPGFEKPDRTQQPDRCLSVGRSGYGIHHVPGDQFLECGGHKRSPVLKLQRNRNGTATLPVEHDGIFLGKFICF